MSLILWLFHLITSLRRGATPVSQNPPGMDISIIKPILLYDPFGCKLQSNFASDFGHHLVWVVHLSCYGTKKALTHVLVICQGHGGIRCAYSACFKRDRFCWSCSFWHLTIGERTRGAFYYLNVLLYIIGNHTNQLNISLQGIYWPPPWNMVQNERSIRWNGCFTTIQLC